MTFKTFACWKYEGYHIEQLCNEVERVRVFTYQGDRVNAGEGCEAAVTVRATYGMC